MLTYALLFFGGALAHKILSRLFAIGYGKIVTEEVNDSILILMTALQSDVELAMKIKQKSLKETDVPDTLLKKTIESDKIFIKEWREHIIIKMISSWPPSYFQFIPFSSWETAQERIRQEKED